MGIAERYRIWLADDTQWQPGPIYNQLTLALDQARRLAVTRWVAIELPTREWHIFEESNGTRLGPPQFARGSDLDLTERAAQVTSEERRHGVTFVPESSGHSSYRISGVRRSRPMSAQPANPVQTHSGIGPESVQRAPASARPSATQPIPRKPRQPRTSTARSINERRAAERYAAEEVLDDPACHIDGQRVEIEDVSEVGLQLVTPPRVRLRLGSAVVLAFSDRHGRFDLLVRVIWVRGTHAGVQIEPGSANLVGKMFLRKLIGKLVARREARKAREARDKKRPTRQ